jgi:hypothetical protein
MRIFSAVWATTSHEVYKYKARLNLDGSQMHPGKDYGMSYAPVASWESVRILLSLVLRHKWKTKQLDYVQAFPQAPVECECYMRVPRGIIIQAPGQWVLRVKRNIHGEVVGCGTSTWVSKLTSPRMGFVQSQYDECVFYHVKAIHVLYTDDSILAGQYEEELSVIIARIKRIGLDVTEEGDLGDFLGINIGRMNDHSYHLPNTAH